jgi:AmiR/NasT family two-component response regulator
VAEQAENMQQAMASRAVIEQAMGVVMARVGCDADAAFQLLVEQSQHENRKLRDVAAELVERAVQNRSAPG